MKKRWQALILSFLIISAMLIGYFLGTNLNTTKTNKENENKYDQESQLLQEQNTKLQTQLNLLNEELNALKYGDERKAIYGLIDENNNLKEEVNRLETLLDGQQKLNNAKAVDRILLIDGAIRELSEDQFIFAYNDDIYLPVDFIAMELGKEIEHNGNWLIIGGSYFTEGFLPMNSTINMESSIEDLEKALGKVIKSEKQMHENIGEITRLEFDGVILSGSSDITITKPVLQTYRGITIGSSKEEVRKLYGNPNSSYYSEDRWIYGDYKKYLWFEFKDNKVSSFGIFTLDW